MIGRSGKEASNAWAAHTACSRPICKPSDHLARGPARDRVVFTFSVVTRVVAKIYRPSPFLLWVS